ncbi:MAG: DUF1801 domain-containing protein [Flavobacteriales bacterium]|nr:DUF1801 domain-containing protein [Flavobacteriales bacterium]
MPAKIQAATASAYFDELASDRKEALLQLRSMIRKIWPACTEDLSLGMPTFHLNGHAFCAIADQKRFMAIYLMHYDLLIAFKNELKRFDCGKSCIRFKRIEPELMDLLDRVIKFTGSQMELSIHYGKPGNTRGSSGRLS